jgi:FixJ family two-component response regulator
MKAGAFNLITKPFDDQALLDSVNQALEHGRMRHHESRELKALRDRFGALSVREREVMALVVRGRLNKESAAELGISEKTIKAHRAQVMRKMEAASLADLVRMADRLGLPL